MISNPTMDCTIVVCIVRMSWEVIILKETGYKDGFYEEFIDVIDTLDDIKRFPGDRKHEIHFMLVLEYRDGMEDRVPIHIRILRETFQSVIDSLSLMTCFLFHKMVYHMYLSPAFFNAGARRTNGEFRLFRSH